MTADLLLCIAIVGLIQVQRECGESFNELQLIDHLLSTATEQRSREFGVLQGR